MHSSPDVPLHTTVVSCPLPLSPVPGQQLRLRSLFLQTSLNKLLEALGKAEPFFIRCIRSNAEKVSGGHRVWGQDWAGTQWVEHLSSKKPQGPSQHHVSQVGACLPSQH